MTKLTLTYVNRIERMSTPKVVDGKTVPAKPYVSISVKATEYGNEYLSGFGNKDNENWKVGDVVEVAEVKEVVKGDKKYLNFEMPKKANGNPDVMLKLEVMDAKINEILNRVMRLGDSAPDTEI